jgi:predicted solute-binding protein
VRVEGLATASAKRVASATRRRAPQLVRARRRSAAASTSTATSCQFLAALRTMAGPPMSMFSIASSQRAAGRATVCSKG